MADSEQQNIDHPIVATETTCTDQSENITVVKRENKSFEAEDIVADAIKLDVDDDLNEHRSDALSGKSASYEKKNSLDNANIEDDEPNYEIDENDHEQYLNEQNSLQNHKSNGSTVEKSENEEGDKQETRTDNSNHDGRNDEAVKETQVENKKNDSNDADAKPSNTKSESNEIDKVADQTTSASKSSSSKDAVSSSNNKETSSKKDTNKNHESESKSSKSKSASSKDKASDHKTSSSNDKIVWVSGFSSTTKDSDLQSLFKKHGKVVSVKIMKNSKYSSSKPYALITMESKENAESCIKNLHKTEFDGKTIVVEKNRSEEKKSSDSKRDDAKKDKNRNEKKRNRSRSRSKSRSRSPKGAVKRKFSPIRRFPLPGRPVFPVSRRARPAFASRSERGAFTAAAPFHRIPFRRSKSPVFLARKFEAERLIRRREFRELEFRDRERSRREEDEHRRQKEMERRQHEEREKLEREKMKLKIERERLEREKVEFLRIEREKARIERERLEREKEEFRRKQHLPVTSGRLDDRTTSKRGYDDLYESSTWIDSDRKRSSSFANSTGNNTTASLTAPSRYDLGSGLGSNNFTNFPTYLLGNSNADLVDRRKLDVALTTVPSSSLRDSNRSSNGYDRDDRRQPANSSTSLGYTSSASRSSLSVRDREQRRDRDDWKSSDVRRSDSNATASQSSYLSSATRNTSYERPPDAWSTAPDRMPPASSLGKFSSYASANPIAERNRTTSNLTVMGSTIGMYNAPSIENLIPNTNYNSSLGSSHRRY